MKNKINTKNIIISICLTLIFILIGYSYRLFSADLVSNWYSTGGFIGGGSSKYYVINSKNGSKTYTPSFLLSLIGYSNEKVAEENSNWEEKISKLNPEFAYSTYVSGQLDEDTIIFLILIQDSHGWDMYKYSIRNNEYEFLMHNDNSMDCVAGNGKIFIRITTVPSDLAKGLRVTIYRYYPENGEKVRVGEYRTQARNLSLEKVLK